MSPFRFSPLCQSSHRGDGATQRIASISSESFHRGDGAKRQTYSTWDPRLSEPEKLGADLS